MAIVRVTPRALAAQASVGPTNLADVQTLMAEKALSGVPVDVKEVAIALGLRVCLEQMEDEISGYLERRPSGWVIGINAIHHPSRQRFTIAHELAHYTLHRTQQTQFRDQTFARRNGSPNPMEREADAFAAQLLMPADQVREWVGRGVKSLNELAEKFRVSAVAMKFRLLDLRYRLG